MNTHRQLSFNNTNVGKNLEKLSSGFKINRAGDDAAGLAISEKMRAQIKGLDMAQKNAQDGISLIQTAEGALAETHSILQRMRELAVQSSSDTNMDKVDREAIQGEINALQEEINDITDRTEFNTQTLLDGSFTGKFQIGANEGQNISVSIDKMDAAALGLTKSVVADTDVDAQGLKDGSYSIDGGKLIDAKGNAVGDVADNTIELANGNTITFGKVDTAANIADGSTITIKDGKAEIRLEADDDVAKLAAGTYEISGTNVLKDGVLVGEFDSGSVTFDNIVDANGDKISFDAAKLGLETALADGETFTIGGIDLSNREQASASVTAIDNALNKVSTQRANLGAIQNRLEHTINNLGASSENLSAAESRIRDTDHMQVAA